MNQSIIERADGSRLVIHEPEHNPIGDPCTKCGLKVSRHRYRNTPERRAKAVARAKERAEEKRQALLAEPIVGIDGEGKDGMHVNGLPHIYTYLSAVDENGLKRGSVYSPYGLSTKQCLDFLIDLEVSRVFGFSLGYDFTMMLKDMPALLLYQLVRPDMRAREHNGRILHTPIYWEGFKFSYLRRRLQIQRYREEKIEGKHKTQKKTFGNSVVIWDVFAFYQSKFVTAITNWSVCPQSIIDEISRMKDQRGGFDKMTIAEIAAYCDKECELLAKLVRKLIEAHEIADLRLKSFYGAGSTSSALLTKMGVKEFKQDPPPEMLHAVMSAFFGGRFELSYVGLCEEPCFGHDINSAYPYAMCFLPCLTHGKWKRIKHNLDSQIRTATLALVHCKVKKSGPDCWGALPFRDELGNITFPLACDGTWVWKSEYLAARDTLWSGVQATEAWVYNTACDCRPFKDMPEAYKERLRLGANGAGQVLKLGVNGGYGKCAQSQGSAPFRSMIWAGIITSMCRAQCLGGIALARDPASVKMVATDGILATEKLSLPLPMETGTGHEINGKKKPLGGWDIDDKSYKKGTMLCRPGIYFPLNSTEEDLKKVRARGIHRGTLLKHANLIIEHFQSKGYKTPYDAGTVTRFIGAKQGIGIGKGGKIEHYNGFADWAKWPVQVSFNPDPKRKSVRSDGTLVCWRKQAGESQLYKAGLLDSEALAMKELEEVMEDQPDGDFNL